MATRTLTVVLAGDAKGAVDALNEGDSAFGKFGKAAALAGVAGVAALGAIGVKGVLNIAKLETGLSEVRTLLPTLTDEGFAKLRDDVIAFSNEMGVATDEAVPALYSAISAGVPPENVIEFMKLATAAAVGGVTDLETAVDGITTVVNSFGADIITAAEASDLMFTAVKLGKTTFEELSSSLSNVTPIAAAMGVGFDEVAAALAVMTAQGVPTSVATTQLRSAITELTKVLPSGATVLQATLGKTLQELQQEGMSFGDVLDAMRTKLGDAGFQASFGSVEAYQAALAVTGKNAEGFNKALDEMKDSTGATSDAFDVMSDTIGFRFEKIMNRLNNLLTEVGVVLLPIVEGALDALVPAIQTVAKWVGDTLLPQIAALIDYLGGVVAAVAPVVSAVATALIPVLQELHAAWVTIWDEIVSVFGEVKTELAAELSALGASGIQWSEVMSAAVSGLVVAIGVAVPIVIAAVRTIGNILVTFITVGTEIISFFKNVFAGDWAAAWQDVQDIGAALMDGIARQIDILFFRNKIRRSRLWRGYSRGFRYHFAGDSRPVCRCHKHCQGYLVRCARGYGRHSAKGVERYNYLYHASSVGRLPHSHACRCCDGIPRSMGVRAFGN